MHEEEDMPKVTEGGPSNGPAEDVEAVEAPAEESPDAEVAEPEPAAPAKPSPRPRGTAAPEEGSG